MKKKYLDGLGVLFFSLITIIGCNQNNQHKHLALTYLKIGSMEKTGDEITSYMDFGETTKTDLKVDYKLSLPDIKVRIFPELKNGFWEIQDDANELVITIERENEKKEYKAKILKKTIDTDIISTVFVSGGTQNGEQSSISDEQISDILSGNDVTVELVGPVASIIVASETKEWTSFKINGKDVEFQESGFKSLGQTDLNLPKKDEEIEIKIEASVGEKHTEINFKIKRLEGLVDIPDMNLIVENKIVMERNDSLKLLTEGDPKPSYTAPETAKIELFSSKDFIEAIEIDSSIIAMKNKKNENGEEIFFAEYEKNDIAPNGKEVSLKVIPKDKECYSQHLLTFKLEYKPMKSNAEFEFYRDAPDSPIITDKIKWVNDIKRNYPDDYGAKSVKVTAHTVAPKAKVYYKFVYLELEEDANGSTVIKEEKELSTAVEMTYKYDSASEKHQHTSDEISLFPDKPSRLKIYVVAEDGSIDNDRGVYYALTYNSIHLRWDYTKYSTGKDFKKKSYDEIRIKKDSVQDKKIYLSFRVFNESDYSIDNSKITPYQTQFRILDTDSTIYDWISTEVDVSELIDNSKEEIEAVCPMLYKGEQAFTYKVKIKLE